jgi:NAD(P)H dehydrogenase (quinone)
MSAHVLVTYYSSYGHVHSLAQAVRDGASRVEATEVRLRRIPELPAAREAMSSQEAYVEAQEAMEAVERATLDDLRWAHAVAWGTPTRFGNMSAQMKQFIDQTGPLWASGQLVDKPTGIFTSTNTIHGGQESTILTSLVPLLHQGMIFVGTPYSENEEISTADAIGGSPYGPSTVAGPDGSRTPADAELRVAARSGERLARTAAKIWA